MSNFRCEKCGQDILEGSDGQYITGCEHYPKVSTRSTRKISGERNLVWEAVHREQDLRAMSGMLSDELEREEHMTDKKEKPFWMVWNPRGRAPAVQHADEQSARKEVERLVQREAGPIYLLEATACAQRTNPPVEWAELSAAPESPETHQKAYIGILHVETDWDFGMVIAGQSYTDYEFSATIYHLDELREVKLLGPFGASDGGKTWEIEEALRRILTHPEEPFSTLGGDRGVEWLPADPGSVDEELSAAPESPEDRRKAPMCGPPPPHLGDSLGAYQCRRCLRVPCRCDWSELEERTKDEHSV